MPGRFLGPGRQIDSQDNQASVSRFAGQTETQDSRPYAPTRSPAGMVVRSTISFSMPDTAWVKIGIPSCHRPRSTASPQVGFLRNQATLGRPARHFAVMSHLDVTAREGMGPLAFSSGDGPTAWSPDDAADLPPSAAWLPFPDQAERSVCLLGAGAWLREHGFGVGVGLGEGHELAGVFIPELEVDGPKTVSD